VVGAAQVVLWVIHATVDDAKVAPLYGMRAPLCRRWLEEVLLIANGGLGTVVVGQALNLFALGVLDR
jgi:hypothetical protein